MLNYNIYKLFNYYTTKNCFKSKETRIYRYRFQSDFDFKNMYTNITEIFKIGKEYMPHHHYLDAVFIVQDINNEYYLTFFILLDPSMYLEDMETQFCQFHFFLTNLGANYTMYNTDKNNLERYECYIDVEFTGLTSLQNLEDKRPVYSYWNWLYDITNSKIKRCILLDEPSHYSFDEKNIYNLRKFILELTKYSNFYFIHFGYFALPCAESDMDIDNLLLVKKSVTLYKEKESYEKLRLMNGKFSSYWEYEQDNKDSFLPIYLVGFVDKTMLLKRDIFYIELEFLNTEFEVKACGSVYNLFDKSLKTVEDLDCVVMYRPVNQKNYIMLFVIRIGCNEECIQNDIRNVLNNYCKYSDFKTIDNLKYDFYLPADRFTSSNYDELDYRHIKIEINSLVFGLYTNDTQFWVFFNVCLGWLIDHECIDLAIETADDCWFKSEKDANFMAKNDLFDYTFLKLQ